MANRQDGWRDRLDAVLAETNGNVSKAARRLGKHRRSLHRELRERRREPDVPVDIRDEEGLTSVG
jgi:ActR/RegA family two-component response regulator